MGRAPCCDKDNVKKGPWSPEEDAKLKDYIEKNGTGGNWIALPQKIGLKRCGKSCRLRWLNYLRPNIKHGGFSEEEDNIICSLYISIGSRWSIIAAQLPGRTDNDIKNYWNTRLKKKLLGKQRKDQNAQARRKQDHIKRSESHNLIEARGVIINQVNYQISPYWPSNAHLPLAFTTSTANTTQFQDSNDQESIKNLLIKLGGRFSDDPQIQPSYSNNPSIQYPCDVISFPQEYSANTSTTATATTNITTTTTTTTTAITCASTCHELPNMYQTHQEFENFASDDQFVCTNILQAGNVMNVDGSMLEDTMGWHCYNDYGIMEGLDNMVNGSSTGGTSSSTESADWGSMSTTPFVYSTVPLVSSDRNYETSCQQGGMLLPRDVAFEDQSSYFGGLQ